MKANETMYGKQMKKCMETTTPLFCLICCTSNIMEAIAGNIYRDLH